MRFMRLIKGGWMYSFYPNFITPIKLINHKSTLINLINFINLINHQST